MADSFFQRLKKSRWNIFKAAEEENYVLDRDSGGGSSSRRDKMLLSGLNGKDYIFPIFNRIGIDVAGIPLRHARVGANGSFESTIDSHLNRCLTLSANIDQTGRQLIQDVAMSLCDEGVVAIVPVDTIGDPFDSMSYDILSLRVGKITQWYASWVEVELYNELSGKFERIKIKKELVAIVENPLYAVMNDTNSTLKRLLTKIQLLDQVDNQSGSGKLDIIIQLPFALKGTKKLEQAELRKQSIEDQLYDSKYGIAYIDATERVIQLNRPAENNLMTQIEYLDKMLWNQLGLTQGILDGTADEAAIINYWNRSIEPFVGAITDAMTRTFITKTGWTQRQRILGIRDPFKMVQTAQLTELADTLTRNEILSSNEFRTILGLGPSDDPEADKLRNKNIGSVTKSDPVPNPVEMEGEKINDNAVR